MPLFSTFRLATKINSFNSLERISEVAVDSPVSAINDLKYVSVSRTLNNVQVDHRRIDNKIFLEILFVIVFVF